MLADTNTRYPRGDAVDASSLNMSRGTDNFKEMQSNTGSFQRISKINVKGNANIHNSFLAKSKTIIHKIFTGDPVMPRSGDTCELFGRNSRAVNVICCCCFLLFSVLLLPSRLSMKCRMCF